MLETRIDWSKTALLITDPQVDVLSPEGVLWDLVGDQLTRLGVVGNLVALRDQAIASGVPVFYSWLQLHEHDYEGWMLGKGLQSLMAERGMLLAEKGARFVAQLEPTPETIVLSPRRGPSAAHSDMILQLRQRGIETLLMGGMLANLCLESHVREVTELGFDAIVVEDATATTDDATLDATLKSFGLWATELVETDRLIDCMARHA